ncbi:NACHT domain-containing NTPase [Microcoleus sp. Pol12B5]|uniref:NACHT domain-containing NTPase n=1 Tax=Microcoleus sp. Pol12B5 TaxID=3055396 RepID=UPI002FD0E158
MDAKRIREIFDKLPSKRKQVLLRVLAGESRAKIACDICDGSTDAVQQNLRQLYKNFQLQDETERKLPALIALFAQSMPELISVGNSQGIKESQLSVYDDETLVGGQEANIANPITSVDQEQNFGWVEDASEDNPDVLVQRVRSHPYHTAKIKDQCGQLRILDVEWPVEIDNIYIEVKVLEKLPSNSRKTISDFLSLNSAIDKSDRLDVDKSQQERVPGLEVAANNLKLMVLGKQGSGKTTFLNHLAIQCNQGRFQSQLIPIFIELKYFAMIARDKCNFSLLNYIIDELLNCDVWEEQINTLLFNGRVFILLDGLDEVEPENADAVLTEIYYFSKHYFRNKFVISCRIATQLANRGFSLKFTEVEVADFKSEQIKAFAKKWFVAVARNSIEQGLSQAAEFIKKLYLSEHQSILELAGTPILLNLACLVFQEKTNFPSTRAKLYEEGLDILLFRWDEAKNIKRDEIYRKLPVRNKKQLLSHVAAITFERGDEIKVFERDIIEQIIADGLTKLTDEKNAPVQVQLDSEAVLKSIAEQDGLLVERARGIYSFSHLTFQEYFTAWKFANSLEPQVLEKLLVHISEERWRDVFLLTSEMLPSADELMRLMKEQIDKIIPQNDQFQKFFGWLKQKSLSVKNQDQVPFRLATVRSWYFAREVDRFSNSMREPVSSLFKCAYALEQTVYFGSNNALDLDSAVYFFVVFADKPKVIRSCALDAVLELKPELKQKLEKLKDEIPELPNDEIAEDEISEDEENKEKSQKFNNWFGNDFSRWFDQVKFVTTESRNIGHDWQFNEEYKTRLRQYYDANKLLVDCLNSSRNRSPTIRAHIEETFLLPQTKYFQQYK